jgi:hypothetical protein
MVDLDRLLVVSRFDVEETWSRWVEPDTPLTTMPVCCRQRQFIIELAPDQAIDQLNEFMD